MLTGSHLHKRSFDILFRGAVLSNSGKSPFSWLLTREVQTCGGCIISAIDMNRGSVVSQTLESIQMQRLAHRCLLGSIMFLAVWCHSHNKVQQMIVWSSPVIFLQVSASKAVSRGHHCVHQSTVTPFFSMAADIQEGGDMRLPEA